MGTSRKEKIYHRTFNIFALSAGIVSLFSCSQMQDLNLESSKPTQKTGQKLTEPGPSSSDPNDNYREPGKPPYNPNIPGGRACTSMAAVGLQVEVLFSPGLPQSGTVRLTGGLEPEEYEIGGPDSFPQEYSGIRIKGADGKIGVWQLTSVGGAVEKPGTYQVLVKANGQEFKKENVVVKSDECHVIPTSVSFEVSGPGQIPMDPTKEYYPLDGGKKLLELDSQTKIGKIVGSRTTYTEVEVVRILMVTTTSGSGPSSTAMAGLQPEKEVVGKTKLGSFSERNIDRGPLPKGDVRDDGAREIYGKLAP